MFKPRSILFSITLLLPIQQNIAAPQVMPVKGALSNHDLQLAMLELNNHAVVQAKAQTIINSRVRSKTASKHLSKTVKKQKRSVRIQGTISKWRTAKKRSSNCLNWSATQINQKAKRFESAIIKYARRYSVDKNLVKSVIAAESCFNRTAKSHANAQGLMQLIPATAKRFGVRNSYNSDQNIRGGVKYLRFLKDRYNGDLKKVIAAYNAGEGAVDKYKGIPPYKETQKYVNNVLQVYARLDPTSKRLKSAYNIRGKAGRHGWKYNRILAPHLYKK